MNSSEDPINHIKDRKNPPINRGGLSTKESWAYSAAVFGLLLIITTFNSFSYTYVIYIIGLDEYLASIGISIGLVAMAFGGPIFGYLSDNIKPTKFGRRKIFILIGSPLLILSFIAMWYFPIKCHYLGERNWGVALYYWILNFIFSLSFQCIWSPYIAMLPEISETEENRLEIAAKQGLFNLIATVIGILLPFILLSGIEDIKTRLFYMQAGGMLIIKEMLTLSVLFSVLALASFLWTFFSISEPKDSIDSIYLGENNTYISKGSVGDYNASDDGASMGFLQFFGSFLKPLENEEFAWWSTANFIITFGMRIPMTILMGFLAYVLEIEGITFILFILAELPFVGGAFFYWQYYSKKHGAIKTFVLVIEIVCITLVAGALLLVKPEKVVRLIFGFVLILIIVSSLVAFVILPNPIVSKIIDNEQVYRLETKENLSSESNSEESVSAPGYHGKPGNERISGSFFGLLSFIISISGALSTQFLGFLLSGGGSRNYYAMVLTLPLTGVILAFSIYPIKKTDLEKRTRITWKGGIKMLLYIGLPIIITTLLVFIARSGGLLTQP